MGNLTAKVNAEKLKKINQELEKTKKILADILKLSKSIIRNMRKTSQVSAQMVGYVSDFTFPQMGETTTTFEKEEK